MQDDWRTISGVGKRIAQDLRDLGYPSVASLRGEDPQAMFARMQTLRGVKQDRCLLYVFRLAVYVAENGVENCEPETLKWWDWSDGAPGKTKAETPPITAGGQTKR